jgi:hypothetical protein
MSKLTLSDGVARLAALSHGFTDADLGQPWRWREHNEGVRFALIGTYHELQDLAVRLAHTRAQEGPRVTAAQRALAPYHMAYRDLEAQLLGVDEEAYGAIPAPGEWALRTILGHIVGAERHFFTLVEYGVRRQRDGGDLPPRLPEDETDKVVGPREEFVAISEKGDLAQTWAFYEALHGRALAEFATITDEELAGPSSWWEQEEYSLQYRLHRFDAHLRQHTVQAEKCLAAIGGAPNEAKRLLRLVYQALAEVENKILGAPEVGKTERAALAERIIDRAKEAAGVVAGMREMAAAVGAGDLHRVEALLAENKALANAKDQSGLSMVLKAAYRRATGIVTALVEAGAALSAYDGAAIGRIDVVEERMERWAEYVDEFVNVDGFTPLQLACFFNHEEIALWLMELGANVNTVAQNEGRIQPIHAAATTGSLTVVAALLAHGADVNGKQQNDFTPLHAAAGNGDKALAGLLLEHGADAGAMTEDGRTALDIAQEKGHHELVPLLS